MKIALDVAKYFINKSYKEHGGVITQKKIQKLVFYAQAWSLVFLNRPMFDEELQAWRHGAVAFSLRSEYKSYYINPLPEPEQSYVDWTNDERKVLDEVWRVYGILSADRLEELNHEELPWKNARVGCEPWQKSQEPIHYADMKYYFQHFKGEQPFEIADEASNPEKEPITKVKMINGDSIEIPIKELENFLIENADSIERHKGRFKRKRRQLIQ